MKNMEACMAGLNMKNMEACTEQDLRAIWKSESCEPVGRLHVHVYIHTPMP